MGGDTSQCPVSPSRNELLTPAVKNYAKADIKILHSYPVLLDIFIVNNINQKPSIIKTKI